MNQMPAVSAALDQLEATHQNLATLGSRDDGQRQLDLIKLRRKFSVEMGEVNKLVEALLAKPDQANLLTEYRTLFSHFRSATARHQANWPAVTLAGQDDEYRTSARMVTEAGQAYIAWVRQLLRASS